MTQRDLSFFAIHDVDEIEATEGVSMNATRLQANLRGAAVVLAAGALATMIWSCSRPSQELRYRLTVEVETPQGLRTGSSVIEVRGVKNPDWVNPEGRGTRSSFRGEAVAVELPSGKTLFALLKSAGGEFDAADYPGLAFRDRLKDSHDWLESMRKLREWKGVVVPMPASETVMRNGGTTVSALPRLVAFGDMTDPESVEEVNAAALDASFGAGVKLRRITVEITDDAVTTDMVKRLPWLTSNAVMTSPGWGRMSYDARRTIVDLFSGTIKIPK